MQNLLPSLIVSSSTKPTPATTPTKQRSVMDLVSLSHRAGESGTSKVIGSAQISQPISKSSTGDKASQLQKEDRAISPDIATPPKEEKVVSVQSLTSLPQSAGRASGSNLPESDQPSNSISQTSSGKEISYRQKQEVGRSFDLSPTSGSPKDSPGVSLQPIHTSNTSAIGPQVKSNTSSVLSHSQATSISSLDAPVEVSCPEPLVKADLQTTVKDKSKPSAHQRKSNGKPSLNVSKKAQKAAPKSHTKQKDDGQTADKPQQQLPRKNNQNKHKTSEALLEPQASATSKSLLQDTNSSSSRTSGSNASDDDKAPESASTPSTGSDLSHNNSDGKCKKKSVYGSTRKCHVRNSSSMSGTTSRSQNGGTIHMGTNKEAPTTPKKSMSSSNLVLDDKILWPALDPSTSPQSSIADGKRPPPISTTITRQPVVRKASSNQLVVPAVPKNFKSRP